ncbi:hypothetical protein GCM10020254_47860 [Streptomyces goshikiensis]
MPAMVTPNQTTVVQSEREYPRTLGRQISRRTTAAAARRSVTTPAAPTRGIAMTARAAPNCTEIPAETTSATGPSGEGRALPPAPVARAAVAVCVGDGEGAGICPD